MGLSFPAPRIRREMMSSPECAYRGSHPRGSPREWSVPSPGTREPADQPRSGGTIGPASAVNGFVDLLTVRFRHRMGTPLGLANRRRTSISGRRDRNTGSGTDFASGVNPRLRPTRPSGSRSIMRFSLPGEPGRIIVRGSLCRPAICPRFVRGVHREGQYSTRDRQGSLLYIPRFER